MTRIRKRPSTSTATSLPAKPETQPTENDNRGLQQLPAAAGNCSSGGFSSENTQKQLVATVASLCHSKPYILTTPNDRWRGNDDEDRALPERSGKPRQEMEVGELGIKEMRVHGDELRKAVERVPSKLESGDETRTGPRRFPTELQSPANTASHVGQRAEGAHPNACSQVERSPIQLGSASTAGTLKNADPTDTDDGTLEQPRKMLPLQLILHNTSEAGRATAAAKARLMPLEPQVNYAKIRQPCNPSTSIIISGNTSTMNSKPQLHELCDEVPAEQCEASACQRSQRPSIEAAHSECPGLKADAEASKSMRKQSGYSSICNDAEGSQSLPWAVSSGWQGHRRARSFLPSGRLVSEAAAPREAGIAGVNTAQQSTGVMKAETAYPITKEAARLMQMKNPISPISQNDPISTNSEELSHFISAAQSPNDPDSMRCRRKDGRRWRCKEVVVRPGAPFCRYHTLKMKRKHMKSVAQRPAKRLQGELKGGISVRTGAGSKRISQGNPVPGGGESSEDSDDDKEEEEDTSGDTDSHKQESTRKQQQQQEVVQRPKKRWRKKCKPSIRRLLDIQDRPRPAIGNDGGGIAAAAASTWVVRKPPSLLYKNCSSLRRPASPLPECLFNTDPREWRSDFP